MSCKKFVEIERPQNKLLTAEMFSSDETALSGMYGIYSFIGRNQSASGMLTSSHEFGGMSADELNRSVSWELDDQFEFNSLQATNGRVRFLWENAYRVIYYSNSMIEGLNASIEISEKTKNQLLGESYFLRSLYFFKLVNFFGDVPLILSTDYRVNYVMPRTPVATVYKQLEADLELAAQLMENDYPINMRVRPNRFTAKALLARVKLYVKDYLSTENLATDLINDFRYQLEEDLNKVFSTTSREAIWQVYPTDNHTNDTYMGSRFLPNGNAAPTYHMSPHLLNAFETGDQRKQKWVNKITVQGIEYNYVYKYKVRTKATTAPSTEYFTVLRLAEQYLIRAEARAMQNKIDLALSDVNVIRKRAGLPSIENVTTKEEMMEIIMQERRIELMIEFAHRWFDLKRTGKADEVLSVVKGSFWQPTDALYPININDLNTAPNLTQNPGY